MPSGVEVRGYVPRLYEHLAACDVAIVQGGGTTTLELTALRRPFIYFPFEGHFEQNLVVARRLERHGAGQRLLYSQTTPERLAEAVFWQLGREANWPLLPTNGARRAAQLINALVEARRHHDWQTRDLDQLRELLRRSCEAVLLRILLPRIPVNRAKK